MKNNKLPNLIIIMILTLITVIFWVMFTIYKSFTDTPPASVPSEILEPIIPRLDTKILETIKIKINP